ncbi:DUF4384 domain-containing protein [Pseudooceanicola sp.]|uniref:DUF4384 domain-containing protein n=1 Tax=Pseudooceanicola sp. TaxID=1914328 RepID=UPI0035C6D648
MRGAGRWAAGFGASALAHLGAAGLFLVLNDPEPPPEQPAGQSSVVMDTVTAPTEDAIPQEAEGEEAQEAQGESSEVTAGAVPQSRARPVTAEATRPEAVQPDASALPDIAASGEAVTEAAPDATALSATEAPTQAIAQQSVEPQTAAQAAIPQMQAVATLAPPVESLRSDRPSGETLASVSPPAAPSAVTEVPSITVGSTAPEATATAPSTLPASAPAASIAPTVQATATVTPEGTRSAPAEPNSAPAPTLAAVGATAAPQATDGENTPSAPLPAMTGKAALAWQFGDRVVTDPQALATIQAFMSPESLDGADQVRDDLSSVLGGVDCARLSATFIPETGALELRGHIPDPALQGQLLAAMQDQVGDGIRVTANLLHLPKPQCGALSGIAEAGLPQSTDQFTNTRLIGENAQARDYSFTDGQRLQFDLTAPDYDAFVYVDYFTADGEVIHLVPNDIIPLERHEAKSVVGIGTDRPGKPGLRLTIGAPFGQEIAVAFAASDQLYEGLRPISEPADAYLAFLKDRIAAAREANPQFKGEWVYFFITTSPATQ